MMVLAMDIATRTGVCVGDHTSTPRAWSEDLGKGRSEDGRFSKALVLTNDLIKTYQPELIVVEAAIGGKTASAFLIGLLACVRGCAFNRGVPVEQVSPATVRKHFVGKALTTRDFPGLSHAKAKQAIKQVVVNRCRLIGWDVPDHDSGDAAACWDFGCAKWAHGYQAAPQGRMFA